MWKSTLNWLVSFSVLYKYELVEMFSWSQQKVFFCDEIKFSDDSDPMLFQRQRFCVKSRIHRSTRTVHSAVVIPCSVWKRKHLDISISNYNHVYSFSLKVSLYWH